MKKKHHRPADHLQWETANELINDLIKDDNKRLALIVASGIYTGLRFSDIMRLSWENLLSDNITISEQKTGKERNIKVSPELKEIVQRCIPENLYRKDISPFVKKGRAVSIQAINSNLKRIKEDYSLEIDNFSSHTLRKTYGRRIYEISGKTDFSLLLLAEIFRHSNTLVTRRYLGILKSEIDNLTGNLNRSL